MANQTGIAITITAFLPTGKTLDEQFNALSIVKNAHATSDYAALLVASRDVLVKTEQKTRRIPDAVIEASPTAAEIEAAAQAQAQIDADYERGFEAGEVASPINDDDANNEAFNHGWAAGFATTPMEGPAPVNQPELVDIAAQNYDRGYAAGRSEGAKVSAEDAANDDFMSGFTAGDKARPQAPVKKPKAA